MIRAGRSSAATGVALVLTVAAGSLEAPASARQPGPRSASPSILVATEIARSRLTVQKGEWKASRYFADESAVLAPKGSERPATSDAREPYQVWVSCDGTLGVTQGALRKANGSRGSFVTVWKRQKNGTYRWVMDQSDSAPLTGDAPDMVSGKVAACDVGGAHPAEDGIVVTTTPTGQQGASEDGSLTWSLRADEPCVRYVLVRMRRQPGAPLSEVLAERIAAAPGKAPGANCWG